VTNREDDELMSMEGSPPSPWIGVQRTTGRAKINGKLLCSRTERHRVRCRRMVSAVPGTGRVASRYLGGAYPSRVFQGAMRVLGTRRSQDGYCEAGVRVEQAGVIDRRVPGIGMGVIKVIFSGCKVKVGLTLVGVFQEGTTLTC
jgi:hypothetical protein